MEFPDQETQNDNSEGFGMSSLTSLKRKTNNFIMDLSEGSVQMRFLKSDTNMLRIRVYNNDVTAIWGKLQFKQSFIILGKKVYK